MFPIEVDNKGRRSSGLAQERVNNEPLTEIHQLKGTSETIPQLSPNDEFANYELLNYLLGGEERAPRIHGSYVREAWENGLAMQESRGYNLTKWAWSARATLIIPPRVMFSRTISVATVLDATDKKRLSGKRNRSGFVAAEHGWLGRRVG